MKREAKLKDFSVQMAKQSSTPLNREVRNEINAVFKRNYGKSSTGKYLNAINKSISIEHTDMNAQAQSISQEIEVFSRRNHQKSNSKLNETISKPDYGQQGMPVRSKYTRKRKKSSDDKSKSKLQIVHKTPPVFHETAFCQKSSIFRNEPHNEVNLDDRSRDIAS